MKKQKINSRRWGAKDKVLIKPPPSTLDSWLKQLGRYDIFKGDIDGHLDTSTITKDSYVILGHVTELQLRVQANNKTMSMKGRGAANNNDPVPRPLSYCADEGENLMLLRMAVFEGEESFGIAKEKVGEEIRREESKTPEEQLKDFMDNWKKWLKFWSQPFRDKKLKDIEGARGKFRALTSQIREMEKGKYGSSPPLVQKFYQSGRNYYLILTGIGMFEMPLNFTSMLDQGMGANVFPLIAATGITIGMAVSAHLIGEGRTNKNKTHLNLGVVLAVLLFSMVTYFRWIATNSDFILLLIGIAAFLIGCHVASLRAVDAPYWSLVSSCNSAKAIMDEAEQSVKHLDQDIEMAAEFFAKVDQDHANRRHGQKVAIQKSIDRDTKGFRPRLNDLWLNGCTAYRLAYRDQKIALGETPDGFWSTLPPTLQELLD